MGKRLTKYMPNYIRDFNLENRVHKYIESDKKTLSPRHPSLEKALKELEENAPKVDDLKINKSIEQMAKGFEVTTNVITKNIENSSRPLPQNRDPIQAFQYGYKEPRVVPNNKVTIKTLNELINSYKEDKSNEKLDELSTKYRIEKEKILILAEYYRSFKILTPTKPKNENTFLINAIFKNIDQPKPKLGKE